MIANVSTVSNWLKVVEFDNSTYTDTNLAMVSTGYSCYDIENPILKKKLIFSGGPLICADETAEQFYIYGVGSWSSRSCHPSTPTGFVKVYHDSILPWIERTSSLII